MVLGEPLGFGGVGWVLSYSVAATPPLCGLGIQNKILARQRALGRGRNHRAPTGCFSVMFQRWLLMPRASLGEAGRLPSHTCPLPTPTWPSGSLAQQSCLSKNSEARLPHQGLQRAKEQGTDQADKPREGLQEEEEEEGEGGEATGRQGRKVAIK